MLYVLVALALPHGYGHRRHRERFRHNEEGVAEQQIDALTLKLEKLEEKVDELMISNAERTRTDQHTGIEYCPGNCFLPASEGCEKKTCEDSTCAPPPQHQPAIPHTEGRTSTPDSNRVRRDRHKDGTC